MSKFLYKHRRGTTSQWNQLGKEITPLAGEIVIEIDEAHKLHKLKIGDGETPYSELKYLMAGDEIVTQVLPRIINITLDLEAWTKVKYPDNPNTICYKQTLPIDGVTAQTKLNLQPDALMLAEFQKLNLVFVAENEIGGTTRENEITVYSIGDMPSKSYTMQATMVEVDTQSEKNKLIGIPVGTPTPQPDWNQTDSTKGDYIKNKPTLSARIKGGVLILEQVT